MHDLLTVVWNILPSTAVMRRATFDAVGGFCEDFGRHPKWEDTWFMTVAREHGAFAYLADPLVLYRVMSLADPLQRQMIGARSGPSDLRRRVERYEKPAPRLFRRLAHQRYGARAAAVVDEIRRHTVNMLVGVGLSAMEQGDRGAARYAYARALEYQRVNPKVWARMAWTYVPSSAAHAISTRLPHRVQRALTGPAQG